MNSFSFVIFYTTVIIYGNSLSSIPLSHSTVVGNMNLPNCTQQDDNTTIECMSSFLLKYGYSMENGCLPPSNSPFFQNVLLDTSDICKNYDALNSCLSSLNCVLFTALVPIGCSSSTAQFYVTQIATLELYCKDGRKFIDNSICMNQIIDNDFEDTIYSECSTLEEGTCDSVAHTIRCEKAVVSTVCSSKRSVSAYCTFQSILLRLSGYTNCQNMPCAASSYSILLIIIMILFKYSALL